MLNVINGVKQYTNYRKDFTPDERIAYNNYVKERMTIYFKTDKGKAKAKEHNQKYRDKKRKEAKETKEAIEAIEDIDVLGNLKSL